MIFFSSIQTRINIAVTGGIFLLSVVAIAAIFQLRLHLKDYQKLIAVTISNEHQIDELSYKLKVQGLDWKNLILRGNDPDQYQIYLAEFESRQADIQQQGHKLLANLPQDENYKRIEHFLNVHETIFKKYKDGAKVFVDSGFDPRVGDKAVTGIDRIPSRMLAESAEAVHKTVMEKSAEISSSSASVEFWSDVLVLVAGVAISFVVWLLLKNALVTPLLKINAHLLTLADGNFNQNLSLQQDGEMGELNKSINTVQASFIMVLETLKSSSKTLNSSSNNLTQSAHDIVTATSEIHSSTDQMATSLNQMSASAQDVANNAATAADAANVAHSSARKGTEVVNNTIKAINELNHEVDNVTSAMTKLEAETVRIGGVLAVIKNVADQTNLLALNAAIEAARAGEQGRGFAVVADEVRSLAKRTQESTAEIQQIIEAVQNGANLAMQAMTTSHVKANTTMEIAGQAGSAIEEISLTVAKIQSLNTQIATTAEQQSNFAAEINRNVTRIVSMVNNTNVQAQKSTQIAASLDISSVDLERQVARFTI